MFKKMFKSTYVHKYVQKYNRMYDQKYDRKYYFLRIRQNNLKDRFHFNQSFMIYFGTKMKLKFLILLKDYCWL